MDRVLTVAQGIFFTLEPAAEAELARFAGGSGGREYLLGRFAESVWAYPLEEGIRLVTKPFTATARLIPLPAGGALLSLQELEPTTPREVTTVFREGQKIVAEWHWGESLEGGAGYEGALVLWRVLRGEGDSVSLSEEPKAMAPPERRKEGPGEKKEEERILPQSEIDRLLNTIKNQGTASSFANQTRDGIDSMPFPAPSRRMEGSLSPPAPEPAEISSPVREEAPPVKAPGGNEEGAIPAGAFLPESRFQPEATAAEPPPEGRSRGFLEGIGVFSSSVSSGSAGPPGSLGELIEGRPYTVVIFKHREEFERGLAACGKNRDATLLAFWTGEPVLVRLGPKTAAHLEELRSTAKGAAAFLETSKERLRRLEEILPNLEEYQRRREVLAAEAAGVAKEMNALRLQQILGTHDGRHLARRIFALEARRQALSKKLALATHRVFRRSTSAARSRFSRFHTRFFLVQRELEIWLEKLSALEREAQRRLEYQTDWQELLKRQIEIERKLGEIAHLMTMAAGVPGEVREDPEAVRRWLSSERDALCRREEFLRIWTECLREERAWVARAQGESFVLLGDEPLLSLPGVTGGAHLVMVADGDAGNPAGFSGLYESCADWVITDAAFRVVESGQGLGQMREPVSSLAEELARRMGIESEEALRTLGLLEVQKTGGYSMGVV